MEPCPCGRERPVEACCGRFLRGEAVPATAEDLMRSRYTAYALGAVDYLVATHDPERKPDRAAIARAAKSTQWHGLDVLRTEQGDLDDTEGKVLFEARYSIGGRPATLRELSLFRRIHGRWFYVGDEPEAPTTVRRDAPKVGRNEPCPCGSGRKYKQCHGR